MREIDVDASAIPATLGRRELAIEGVGSTERRFALILSFVALIVFNANCRLIGSGDSYPTRVIPFALLKYHTLYLDRLVDVARMGYPAEGAYWVRPAKGEHWASLYPVVTPALVTPLYVPATLWVEQRGWDTGRVTLLATLMEKLSASFVAAVAAGLMFLLLRRRCAKSEALLLAVVFAFGTNTWMTSSQALWQHGASQLFLVIALLSLTSTRAALLSASGAGLALGLMIANRPPTVAIAAPLALYALLRWRRNAWAFIVAGAVPMLLVTWYNDATFGMSLGGYQSIGAFNLNGRVAFAVITELLASPTRGIFVFSPCLLFLLFLGLRIFRSEGDRLLNAALALGAIGLVLIHGLVGYRVGFCFGPRFLVDCLPSLVWLLAPILASLGKPARALFIVLGAFGVVVQALGAFYYDSHSDLKIYQPSPEIAPISQAWSIENSPLVEDVSHGPARMDLAIRIKDTLR